MSEIESVKYSSYTPAQKKASQLYRQKNKDKINEQRKKYYQEKKAKDPNFLEYKRIKAKEYYEKKKLDKVVKPETTPVLEEIKVLEEPKIDVVDTNGLLKVIIPETMLVKALEASETKLPPEIHIEDEPSSPPENTHKKKKKTRTKK
jgi:hypothetical protein